MNVRLILGHSVKTLFTLSQNLLNTKPFLIYSACSPHVSTDVNTINSRTLSSSVILLIFSINLSTSLSGIPKFEFIARDRFGKKPLYYYKNKDIFIFSSSLNLIQKYFDDSLEVDENSFLLLNLFSYVPKESTIYKNVKKLLPGSKIQIDSDNFTIKKTSEINKILR